MVFRISLCIVLFASYILGCPENPEPPCTCRMIGYHACIITCVDVDNEVALEKSIQSMRAATVPIRAIEIFESNVHYFPSKLFRGLEVPRLFIAGTSMVSFSDSETAFIGLEDSLETLVVQECILFSGWNWSHLRNLKALAELRTVKAGLLAIDEDIKEIAHLNITKLFLTQDSISYIHDTAFATFHNLVSLSLKMNNIRTMKRSMLPDPAMQLEQIILSHNEFEFIPKDLFTNMPNLDSIILADNKIITIDEDVFKPVWHQLNKINLLDDPLRCDCRLSWLLKVPFPKNTWAKCAEPLSLRNSSIKDLTRNHLWC